MPWITSTDPSAVPSAVPFAAHKSLPKKSPSTEHSANLRESPSSYPNGHDLYENNTQHLVG